MQQSDISTIILAAGKGTRMNSVWPKVLQPLAGQPLLRHVLNTALQIDSVQNYVIYGHGGDAVLNAFANENVAWVEQAQQLGTGHAVQMVLPVLPKTGQSIILYGDVPLISPTTLKRLVDAAHSGIAMITLTLPNPMGYGRIVRENGKITRIVEQKDANAAELTITEVNTGIYCVDNAKLHEWLPKLSNNNAQGEYYLTDIVALAAQDGIKIGSIAPEYAFEVEGVNDRIQLAGLERTYQQHQALQLMKQGMTLADPARFDLRGSLKIGKDVRIDINVIIEGDCVFGDQVQIGAGCVIKNTTIAAGTVVKPYSVFEDAVVGENVAIGPFSRLRPGANIANQCHIGNFVEIKNSRLDVGAKANHLAYIGDAEVGSNSNIGAGTITCNYDGFNKFKTIIGENAFIGTNASLVAPVTIGNFATVGAGSVVTKNVADNQLAVARGQQRNIDGWKRPEKIKK